MLKVYDDKKGKIIEGEGTAKDLICETISVLDFVYKEVPTIDKSVMLLMIADWVKELKN